MDRSEKINVKNYGIIKIEENLIKKLFQYRQDKNYIKESGGVLIGSYLINKEQLLIDKFTPPQNTDRQGRCTFYRSKKHTKLVQKIWKETGHYSTYVGLWHTHSEFSPNYSIIDERDWLKALNESTYEGDHLFFFIVGIGKIVCWVGYKKRKFSQIEYVGELIYE